MRGIAVAADAVASSAQPSSGASQRSAGSPRIDDERRRGRAPDSAAMRAQRAVSSNPAPRRAPARRAAEHGDLLAQMAAAGALAVSCAAARATRRRPGCIRNGAVTCEKSKAMNEGPARAGPRTLAKRARG
jgi:hypothetical protein